MWKRKLICCAAVFVPFLLLVIPTISLAACGGEPPLPAEGFSWPASGPISEPWSLECRTDRGHRGIDIVVSPGESIRASASGVVIFAGYTPAEGGGTTISIEHQGGMRSTYLHLGRSAVSQGQIVSQGQELGLSDGSPLHFGIKVISPREAYFDPGIYLMPSASSPAAGQDHAAVTSPVLETAAVPEPTPTLIDSTGPDPVAAGSPAGRPAELPDGPRVASTTTHAGILSGRLSELSSDSAVPTTRFSSFPGGAILDDAVGNLAGPAFLNEGTAGNAAIVSRMFEPVSGGAVSAFQKSGGEARPYNRRSLIPGGHSAARNMLLCAFLLMSTLGLASMGNLPGLRPASAEPDILLHPVSC